MCVGIVLILKDILIESSAPALSKVLFLFFLTSIATFSQKKATKKFTTTSKTLHISTEGLDDFVLENSASEFIEISCTQKTQTNSIL